MIEANQYNNFTIEELAFLTHRSESTFKRDFKKWYGEPPAKYLKERRLQKALSLLHQPEYSVNEVAWECGFENAAHFSTSFSKRFGKSPKKYRNDLN
jgi:AraC-like DNA-binding protein